MGVSLELSEDEAEGMEGWKPTHFFVDEELGGTVWGVAPGQSGMWLRAVFISQEALGSIPTP